MAKLFPFRPTEEPEVESEPRLVGIDDEAADEVFAALSSETARTILSTLYEEPTTASEVADAVDTSLQNARYHLDKLQEAGLVREVDTWYSSRGTEMTVYGPTSEPLVVAAGEEESRSVLRSALKRVVGAVGILGVASLAVDRLAREFGSDLPGAGGDPRKQSSEGPGIMADGGVETATERAADTSIPAAADAATNTPVETGTRTFAETGTPAPARTPTPEPARTPAPETPLATRSAAEDQAREATATPMDLATQEVSRTPAPSPDRLETTRTITDEVGRVSGGGGLDLGAVSPGLLFFAGGLLAVALAAGWWYWSRYRPLYGE